MIRSISPSLSALLLAAALASNVAAAQPVATALTGYTTLGAGVTPEYEGSADLNWIPIAAGEIRSGNRYAALEGLAARANFIDSARYELGPVASFTFGRDSKVDNLAVSRLPELDGALEMGVFAARTFAGVATEGDALRFAVQAVQDVSDVHDGWLATASASYGRALGQRYFVRVDLSATYVSDDFAQTYFSISPTAATASGLNVHEAGAGIKDVGLGLIASYATGNNWSIDLFAGYRRLVGDTADSPIVKQGGDANQLTLGLGIGRRF